MSESGRAHEWIRRLGLVRHPEGGYYRETWRSAQRVRGISTDSERSAGTAILYLLEEHDRSRLHRIRSDEVWLHHDGGPLTIHVFHPNGAYDAHVLGGDVGLAGGLQVTVPAGCWFGAETTPGAGYALVACVVAPGFEFEDLEWADRNGLIEEYPEQAEIIRRLTPGHDDE